jgi:hypothetical protein
MNPQHLKDKGFSYIGYFSLARDKMARYDSVLSLQALSVKLGDKQYCYLDSETALRNAVSRLTAFGTIRAVRLAHNSFILAWSKAKPKRKAARILYTDLEGIEHVWP